MKNIVIKKIFSIIAKIAPEVTTKILFKQFLGYKLNLEDPKTLNEKMQFLKLRLYFNDELVTKCVDKLLVRDYVSEKVSSKYLTDLYGSWKDASEIDFDALPEKFVLKCNHGSGSNIICRDKSLIDPDQCMKTLDSWMKQNFGSHRAELVYNKVDRMIICEEFIETSDGKPPKDYKFFCNYGKAKFLFVASDRYAENTKFDYYDMNWNWIPVRNGHPNAGDVLTKPSNFNEMVKVVEKLSKPFPLVRVDLYNENGRIIFGEMTFLHFAGLTPFNPCEYDEKFGKMIDISSIVKEKGLF